MSIKQGLNIRFAEIGKIKIGGVGEERPTKDGKGKFRVPVRYNEFVVTTTERAQSGNFIPDAEMMKKLREYNGGEKALVHEIPIRLPFDSIDLNFWTSFAMYQGNKCQCRGDGVAAIRYTDKGEEKQVECNPKKCQYLEAGKCKVSGILSCHIPLAMEVGGIYRFRTHSWNSVSAILAALEYVSQNTRGILQGLPLKMKFLKKATAEHGNVSIVTVVLDGIELMRMRELALAEAKGRAELGLDMRLLEDKARAAGFNIIDPDDPEMVQDEFYGDDNVEIATEIIGTSADDAVAALKQGKAAPEPDQGSLL